MAFGGFSHTNASRPLAEINMIPLIDVMLVLLVIFIITAPLLTHAVKIDLPRAASQVNVVQREHVHLSIDAAGTVYWNGEALPEGGWRTRMQAAAAQEPQPEVHIRADGAIAYQRVATVMADAARVGLTRIGFITDPRPAP
ncbi:MAG: biopolymer transporter ExbD [Thiobacillaceae bacterium]|nr:biopolymer transporter ExbD [Thiobacillaceae bacterium]MCX7673188.1 biopolymer transporter ExbD [Thiobacillaceae bacterium]